MFEPAEAATPKARGRYGTRCWLFPARYSAPVYPGAYITLLIGLTAAMLGAAHAVSVLMKATSPQPIEARLHRCAKCRYPVSRGFAPGARCPECGTTLSNEGVYAPGEGVGATPSMAAALRALTRLLLLVAIAIFVAAFLFVPGSLFHHRTGSSEYTPQYLGRPKVPPHVYRPRVEIDIRGEIGRPASSGVVRLELRAENGREAALTLDAASQTGQFRNRGRYCGRKSVPSRDGGHFVCSRGPRHGRAGPSSSCRSARSHRRGNPPRPQPTRRDERGTRRRTGTLRVPSSNGRRLFQFNVQSDPSFWPCRALGLSNGIDPFDLGRRGSMRPSFPVYAQVPACEKLGTSQGSTDERAMTPIYPRVFFNSVGFRAHPLTRPLATSSPPYTRLDIALEMSRSDSRLAIVCRLSAWLLPRARPTSSLAQAVLEVDLERDQRHPFHRDFAGQLRDLALVGEQLAGPRRAVLAGRARRAGGRVFGDVDRVQPQADLGGPDPPREAGILADLGPAARPRPAARR